MYCAQYYNTFRPTYNYSISIEQCWIHNRLVDDTNLSYLSQSNKYIIQIRTRFLIPKFYFYEIQFFSQLNFTIYIYPSKYSQKAKHKFNYLFISS
jgi:hypothetical protein